MTEGEMRALMGDTVAELAALKKRRACLRTRRDQYRDVLMQAGRVVMGTGEAVLADEGWPSADDIRSLRADLADATERIGELESRLREWGALDS